MDLLKQVGAFFGWLSGVVAGVTAALYALGFIATIARQGMLGLEWAITSREALYYLGLGGQVASRWAFLATVWLLLVIAAGETLLWTIRWVAGREHIRLRAIRKCAAWIDRQLIWLIAILAMLFAGLMMNAFDGALQVRGLLFASVGELCRSDGVLADLAGANSNALAVRADRVAGFAALAIGTCAYAVPRLVASHGPALPMLVCIAVAFQAVAAIPTAHGIFLLDTRLRSTEAGGEGIEALPAGDLWLVTRSRDGVWVWEPIAREVYWLAEGSFDRLRIGEARSIRSLACGQGDFGLT